MVIRTGNNGIDAGIGELAGDDVGLLLAVDKHWRSDHINRRAVRHIDVIAHYVGYHLHYVDDRRFVDLKQLFVLLRTIKRDDRDDGTVVGHHNLDEEDTVNNTDVSGPE